MKPNFFLVGGPKCGTTSLATYLRKHPSIFLTDPKEPYYLAPELSPMAAMLGIKSERDYLKLYADANPRQHHVVGEASTLYLSSPAAIQAIHLNYPEAKIVAISRDPLQVAYAFYMQMRLTFFEDQPDFESAWRLQDIRAAGNQIPKTCAVPRLLQYGEVAALGSQLERLVQTFEAKQLLVLNFDDFRTSPSTAYHRILEFLTLADDNRREFPRLNESNAFRSRFLNRIYMLPKAKYARVAMTRILPPWLVETIRPLPRRLLRRSAARAPLPDNFQRELQAYFSSEKEKIAKYCSN